MAICTITQTDALGFVPSEVTLSGTVKKLVGGELVAVERRINLYRNDESAVMASCYSDATDGTFSFTVNGSSNDRFRIIVNGVAGENSQIFDDITGV